MGKAGQSAAEAIRRLRTERHWTLVKVGEEMGKRGRPMGTNALRLVERGERRIDVDDLIAFADVFEVHPAELLGIPTGDPSQSTMRMSQAEEHFEDLTVAADALERLAEHGITPADVVSWMRLRDVSRGILAYATSAIRPTVEAIGRIADAWWPPEKRARAERLMHERGYDFSDDGIARFTAVHPDARTLDEIIAALEGEANG